MLFAGCCDFRCGLGTSDYFVIGLVLGLGVFAELRLDCDYYVVNSVV